jgi:hypothetical protein
MKWGAFSELFVGIAWKRLTATEVDPKVSNGHEFQGVATFRKLFDTDERRRFDSTYMLLGNDDEPKLTIRSFAQWYDSREKQPHRGPEWRLYYPAEAGQIQSRMRPGDLMVLALTRTGELVVLLARAASTREAQLQVLFGLGDPKEAMQSRRFGSDAAISFISTAILEDLGLASPMPEQSGDGAIVMALAEEFSRLYPSALPRGKDVSLRIQSSIIDVDPVADPDGTLVRWIEGEEALFRRWEDGLIARRLERGFTSGATHDVQGFRDFSMSIRQSRVSRAGGALQLHTDRILRANSIRFEAQATTENGERPDFLFPSAAKYHDPTYPTSSLRMLAVKFTARDRWRQVLNEAERVASKHLLTLEAAISLPQLRAMRSSQLQPVVPKPYLHLYPSQSATLLTTLAAFIRDADLPR